MNVFQTGVCALLLGLSPLTASASLPDFGDMTESSDSAFLEADAAFQLQGSYDPATGYRFVWHIADGYYLYRDRVHLQVGGVETPARFDAAVDIKNDPSFGRVPVFHHQVSTPLTAPATADIVVQYQGCADAGLCYPPETRRIHLANGQVTLEKAGAQALVPAPVVTGPLPAPTAPQVSSLEDSRGISDFLGQASLPMVLLTFFLLGLGLTFTPCVFPMLPILTGIIAGDKQTLTARRGFALSLAYVTGMSLSYAALGMVIGYFGARANIQTWLQTPAVLVVFAGVFTALAFSMFGFYELQLPAVLRDRLTAVNQRQQGGTLWSTGLMGAVSALVVSPCVSAPLAGTLVYISSTGDALLGAAALFPAGHGHGRAADHGRRHRRQTPAARRAMDGHGQDRVWGRTAGRCGVAVVADHSRPGGLAVVGDADFRLRRLYGCPGACGLRLASPVENPRHPDAALQPAAAGRRRDPAG
jgi:thiol:disulfide interchange protein DsbD